MIRRPPRSTLSSSSAASDVYKRQVQYVDGPEIPEAMRVSYRLPELSKQIGLAEIMQAKYSDMLTQPINGFDVTVEFSIDNPPEAPEDLALRVALLGRTAAGAALYHHFTKLQETGGKMDPAAPIMVQSRPGENYWIIPLTDKVVVAYALSFLDEESQVIARLCIDRGIVNIEKFAQSAPLMAWSEGPPAEISGDENAVSDNAVGWSIATYFPQHVAPNKLDNTVTQALNWRNILSYHVKAAKLFTTSRMRHRVDFFQKVLDRAVPKKAAGRNTKTSLAAVGVAGKLLGKMRAGAAGEN
eukprot:TRINITY_DN24059_c0_g1_i10.p1 TRINITY_DN24059_c0_g1~~TRINITY_DN24059_c0_g1_i10.p1  ORF type:complete len:299 (+),score=89.38 TRINITY_DN24059_c0_g1_i10:120-1016(+)